MGGVSSFDLLFLVFIPLASIGSGLLFFALKIAAALESIAESQRVQKEIQVRYYEQEQEGWEVEIDDDDDDDGDEDDDDGDLPCGKSQWSRK